MNQHLSEQQFCKSVIIIFVERNSVAIHLAQPSITAGWHTVRQKSCSFRNTLIQFLIHE